MKSPRLNTAIFLFIRFCFFSPLVFSQSLTLENIFYKHPFASENMAGVESMKDGKSFSSVIQDNSGLKIVKTSYETGAVIETLADYNDLIALSTGKKIIPFDYAFNPDETQILFSVLKDKLYRHSTIDYYYLYDLKTKSLRELPGYGMYAQFSPDGKNIAYVRDNNIYITEIEGLTEKQITTDGVREKIINGMTDWVYEEELDINRGFYWSPLSDKIAYFKFDESDVKEFTLTYYEGLYTRDYKYKYPKPGEDNSKVSACVYDLKTGENKTLNSDGGNEFYLPRIRWTNDNNILSYQLLNRYQNKLDLYFCDVNTGSSTLIFSHTNKYYLDLNDDLTFVDNDSFIWNENNNLYLYDLKGKLRNLVSSGKDDVDRYYGYNPVNKNVYYSSSIKSPVTRVILTAAINGSSTENLTPKAGWNMAMFSSDFSYFINTYSTISSPGFITINNSSGKEIRTIETNDALKRKIEEMHLSMPEFFTFKLDAPVPGTDIDYLNGYMVKPKNFDASKKYPVLFYTYGGPGSQTVKDEWIGEMYFWYQYLAEKGIIIVSIDNRGTGARGEEFQKMTYLKLGKYETEDMIQAVKYLRTLPYIDKNNIGVYGWSYGGYMAAMCITQAQDYFKTAVAVAPLTNWRFYDNIYTERYMKTPQENSDGYDNLSPLFNAKNIKGDFLIIHGMTDDNVHLQNTTEMISEMVKNNIRFDSELYPDKNHGISGGKTRLHVYTRITDFLLKSFNLQ